MRPIRINFLAFSRQDFTVTVFRKLAATEVFDDLVSYYTFRDETGHSKLYEIYSQDAPGLEKFNVPTLEYHDVVAKRIFDRLRGACNDIPGCFVKRDSDKKNKRLHFNLEDHPKGRKCVWIEPHFLKSAQMWGLLLGFQFVVNEELTRGGGYSLDKDILIASGSLNNNGQSNLDFYLFKHNYIRVFMQKILPQINERFALKTLPDLYELSSHQLKVKEYAFGNGFTSNSAYFGLSKSSPLSSVSESQIFDFIYLENDRDFAVTLLKGLRGETHPNTFGGMEKLFKVPFKNNVVKGSPLKSYSEAEINGKIESIKQSGQAILPIIITNARKELSDDRLYFFLKNKFTNAGLPCQVVTKDLIKSDNSLKFSLSNIGLQIFAKSGGKPWKMVPAGSEYLIIGIGQSYNIERTADGNTIEKNITYSVLTDSSGIFKDIQVLSEGVETDDSYWQKLVTNITRIINSSGSKKVALHVPFRISKAKVLDKVSAQIESNVELCVLVINDRSDFFGFDYANNGLVPFEGTFTKLSKFDYLTWFEGILPANPKITKRFGNPLLVKFWYCNQPQLFENYKYREALLQDCINLSGANWRGFRAKQLPVSIFYCQRIAEFIAKFREYHLEHIEINNLKPWFL